MGLLKTLGSCNIDLNKNSQDIKRSINCSYWPCITKHDRPFRNIVTIILVIVSSHMGNSFIKSQDLTDDNDDKNAQTGSIKCHRIDSLTIALMYGKERRSSKSGRRCGPTTASISACAFFWTSGYSIMARKKACTADFV